MLPSLASFFLLLDQLSSHKAAMSLAQSHKHQASWRQGATDLTLHIPEAQASSCMEVENLLGRGLGEAIGDSEVGVPGKAGGTESGEGQGSLGPQ